MWQQNRISIPPCSIGASQDETSKEKRRTFGRYIFFQHLSQSTFPPSICIHLPSSIAFSHRTHLRTLGRFDVDALRAFPSAFSSVSRFEGSVGLVCERVGYFADLDTLSRGLSVDMRDELEIDRLHAAAIELAARARNQRL